MSRPYAIRILIAALAIGVLLFVVMWWRSEKWPGGEAAQQIVSASRGVEVASAPGTPARRIAKVDEALPPAESRVAPKDHARVASSEAPPSARRGAVMPIRLMEEESAAPAQRRPTVDEILRAMREAYARLESYTDRGRQMRTWHERAILYSDEPFRTYFKRPGFYRFDWLGSEPWYRSTLWQNRAGFFWSRNREPPLQLSNLGSALRDQRPAYSVAQFLLPQVLREAEQFFTQGEYVDDEEIDGVRCFHLVGRTSNKGHPRELWIGQEDFLLRRISTITPSTYDTSHTPQYGMGRETVRIDYLDVTVALDLPDPIFTPGIAR